MIAVLSHNVLVSNYVPFFEIEDDSLEALDSILAVDGGRVVQGNNRVQLLWIASGPKVMLKMDDESTYVTRVPATLTLCSYPGMPLNEEFCEMFADDKVNLDAWLKGLDVTYITSLRLSQSEAGSCYYRLHPDIVQRAEFALERYLECEFKEYDWRDDAGNVGSEEGL